jgi:hypothetical protein
VKAHGGELKLETPFSGQDYENGKGAEIVIILPI